MPGTDVERLRLLAIDALAEAAQMTDTQCKHVMIGLAASYQRLADHAEARAGAMRAGRLFDPANARRIDPPRPPRRRRG
jgi:hypothetical protein